MTVTVVIPDAMDLRLAAQVLRTGKPREAVILTMIERGLEEVEFEDKVHEVIQEVRREKRAATSVPPPDPLP